MGKIRQVSPGMKHRIELTTSEIIEIVVDRDICSVKTIGMRVDKPDSKLNRRELQLNAAIDGWESLLLSLVLGRMVSIQSPGFRQALILSYESILNSLP